MLLFCLKNELLFSINDAIVLINYIKHLPSNPVLCANTHSEVIGVDIFYPSELVSISLFRIHSTFMFYKILSVIY